MFVFRESGSRGQVRGTARILRIGQFLVLVGSLAVVACGSPDLEATSPGSPSGSSEQSDPSTALPLPDTVPAEFISVGFVGVETSNLLAAPEPPYESQPTEQSQKLRQMSLRVLEMEAHDPERFYTMSMDLATGEVFAVARSAKVAEAYGQRVAPGHRAPSAVNPISIVSDRERSTPGLLHTQAISGSENRVYCGSTTDDAHVEIASAGYLTSGASAASQTGRCTGTLFAPWSVITAAHCVMFSSGAIVTQFSPRQRSNSSRPFGTGTAGSEAISWIPAYTSNNCHVNYTYPQCVYYDTVIISYPHTGSFANSIWAGFGAYSDAYLTSQYSRTVGYPQCAGSGIPGCIDTAPYNDWTCGNTHPSLSGGSSSNSWPYNDGSKPFMRAGCDFTSGQSGSSVFDQAARVIVGLGTFSDCDANCVHSVSGPRISVGLFNWMASYR